MIALCGTMIDDTIVIFMAKYWRTLGLEFFLAITVLPPNRTNLESNRTEPNPVEPNHKSDVAESNRIEPNHEMEDIRTESNPHFTIQLYAESNRIRGRFGSVRFDSIRWIRWIQQITNVTEF
jgi:hypothetical protein